MNAPLFQRSAFDKSLALGGVIIILLQVLLIADVRLQVAVVLVGRLVNQIGVWGLAERLMPDRRTNLELRSEVDALIRLVRKLNKLRTDSDPATLDATKVEMHESVDRIAAIAASRMQKEPAEEVSDETRAA